jgi:hypothetical protein
MNNKNTQFYFDEQTEKFMFNAYDVTREIYFMQNAYITGDYKKLGYLFGSAIDTYAVKKAGKITPSPPPVAENKSIKLQLRRDDDILFKSSRAK